MSYIVTIGRAGDDAILESELRALSAETPGLSLIESDGNVMGILWDDAGDDPPLELSFSSGALDSLTTPSSLDLARMGRISSALRAQLIGEEGEAIPLDSIDPFATDPEAPSILGCFGSLYPIALLSLLIWGYCSYSK